MNPSLPAPLFAELLQQARGGSRDALGALLVAYQQQLLRRARGKLPSSLRGKLDPMDIVQQTFLEAKIAFEQFTGQSPSELQGWLGRILRNALADTRRSFTETAKRQLAREQSLDADAPTLSAPVGQQPESEAFRHEAQTLVDQALESLPEIPRRVVKRHALEGWSFDRIGAEMGISRETARTMFNRAVAELGKRLVRRSGQGPRSRSGR